MKGTAVILIICDLKGSFNVSGSMPRNVSRSRATAASSSQKLSTHALTSRCCPANRAPPSALRAIKIRRKSRRSGGTPARTAASMQSAMRLMWMAALCEAPCLLAFPSHASTGCLGDLNCESTGTTETCIVTCADGFEVGDAETWTCFPNPSANKTKLRAELTNGGLAMTRSSRTTTSEKEQARPH